LQEKILRGDSSGVFYSFGFSDNLPDDPSIHFASGLDWLETSRGPNGNFSCFEAAVAARLNGLQCSVVRPDKGAG
jgi:hypothetical protein